MYLKTLYFDCSLCRSASLYDESGLPERPATGHWGYGSDAEVADVDADSLNASEEEDEEELDEEERTEMIDDLRSIW